MSMIEISPLWDQLPANTLQPMPLRPIRAFETASTEEQTAKEPAEIGRAHV